MGLDAERNRDYEYAEFLYSKSMCLGNTSAMVRIAEALQCCSCYVGSDIFKECTGSYAFADGIHLDYAAQLFKDTLIERHKKSYEFYKQAAQNGNSRAMSQMGRIHDSSSMIGVDCDGKKRDYWYQKAVDSQDEDSMIEVASMYKYSEDKLEEAIQILLKLANSGNRIAMRTLGYIYEDKLNDYQKAYCWFLRGEWWSSCLESLKKKDELSLAIGKDEYNKNVEVVCEKVSKSNDPYDLIGIAKLYSKQDDDASFVKALDAAGKAYDCANSLYAMKEVYKCLGDIYKEHSLFNEAILAYRKGLDLVPYGRYDGFFCESIKSCESSLTK